VFREVLIPPAKGSPMKEADPQALAMYEVESDGTIDPMGVIGATLCMLSCSLQSGTTLHLPKIIANFAWLSERSDLGQELQVCCRRLGIHFEMMLDVLHDGGATHNMAGARQLLH
jgi:hypothetical protein